MTVKNWRFFDQEVGGFLTENPHYEENKKILACDDTALIVVDPWADSGSEHLDNMIKPIIMEKIVPLVQKVLEKGIRVYIFTNDPKTDLISIIHPMLEELIEEGKCELIFHQDYNSEAIGRVFISKGIKNLIYTGFSSNMCVLFRPVGIMPLYFQKKFDFYFIPEASIATAGIEETINRQNNDMIGLMLSANNIAALIDYNEFILMA